LCSSGSSSKQSREEEENIEEEIQKVIDSTIIIKINSETGNGVALSNKKAVTAVHGGYHVGQVVQVIDIHGHTKNGIISFMKYEASKVDIAVVELTGSDTFDHFIPFHTQPVKIGKDINVISLSEDGIGESTESYQRTVVQKIIRNTAIFHASYYATEAMSGCGVVTIPEDGHYSVVGVYVGKHNDTEALADEDKSKKKKPKKQDLEERVKSSEASYQEHRQKYQYHKDQMTINSNIHGHGAYCLICEIARVEDLVDHLNA
jgi:hypothetical protein